jgi:uncharacterized protein (DUF4415 family)
MRFTWDEVKRKRNLKDHGLDFVDARRVFDGATFTFEDDRLRYDEQRFVALKRRIASTSSPFERQPSVKRPSSSKTSRTDWARLRRMKDTDIKRSAEHPEADVKNIVRGIARQGLKRVSGKTSISLRVDAEVLEWFKAQGPGYQTRINAVLKAFKDASA